MFNNRKKRREALINSFGKQKEDGFNLDLITKYFEGKDHANVFQTISNQTAQDLDLDDVFKFLDRTITPIGQMYLYDKLRSINHTIDHSKQEDLIKYFEDNPEELTKARVVLSKVTQHKAYYLPTLFQGKHIDKPRWFFVIPLLAFTMILSLVLGIFASKLLLIPILLLPIHLGIHYYNKLKVNIYIDSIPQLLAMNAVAKKLFSISAIKQSFQDKKEAIQTIGTVKRKMSVFKLEQKMESDMEVIYWFLLEVIKITFLLEPLLLYSMIDKLKNKRKEIESVFTFVGEIDSTISIMGLRKENPAYTIPKITNNHEIIGTKIYHPLIEDSVSNSFTCKDKSFLITGSNMSGKTTFIRTIGINVITGLTLNICFAEEFSFPKMKIHSMIRIADDLSDNSSYFFTEVKAMKNIIDHSESNEYSLILLDELFKGTNTKERVAAATSILNYLAKLNTFVFVSTHDFELTTLLQDNFDNYHFSEKLEKGKLLFDYKLTPGILKETNALRILEMYDYPQEIVENANKFNLNN